MDTSGIAALDEVGLEAGTEFLELIGIEFSTA